LEIEKLKSGKYKIRVWDQERGKRINVGNFTNKAAGQAAGLKVELDLKSGVFVVKRKDITLGCLCDRFLETNTQLNTNTLTWYRHVLKPARAFFGESASTRRVSREDVQRYAASLMAAGKADTTVNGCIKALGTVMSLAMDWEYREDNPARDVRNLPTNKRAVDAIRIVTPEEHQRLVQVAPEGYRVMFSIWPFVGLRRSEMQGLTWSEVDLADRRMRVRYQLREDGTLDMTLKTAKSVRTVYLTDRVVRELAAWKLASRPNDLNLVFPTPSGLPQSCKPQFYAVWNRACASAGLEGCNPHDMRHAFATWSLQAGENPKRVADQMGHEKTSMMLDTYLHLLPEESPMGPSKVEQWYESRHSGDGQPGGAAPILPHAVGDER
jgi:integrase